MLTYSMDARGEQPRYRFLYACIRRDILSGILPPGSRLPSKRSLAEHLNLSVITVEAAYRLLEDEGYVCTRQRSGCFVCAGESLPVAAPVAPAPVPPSVGEDVEIDFPFSSLTRIMRRVISQYDKRLLLKPPHNGCLQLRQAVASFLRRYRGMEVDPAFVVIGSGAEYLYGMIVQLLGRERLYGLEDPSYEKIRMVYAAQGARCELLPMDGSGISPAALEGAQADVLHVTPFHSYPTGITAPASRRRTYLRWARERDAVIIEDDFDSEFAVGAKPVETMFSMDGDGRVIYLNTFSKSLAPSMRMGYMVLPPYLAREYEQKLGFYSCTVPVFDQIMLAEFIDSGAFERHLNRLRRRLWGAKKASD